MKNLVGEVAARVRRKMAREGTGHDWWHVWRVWRLAVRIARSERRALRPVVELGALLHDLGDWKFHGGDLEAAADIPGRLLRRLGAPAELVGRVQSVCREVSYRGAGVADRPTSLEARIVQDADRLDALGAIGIARTFAYGGAHGRALYEPGRKPSFHRTFSEYRRSRGNTLNHFHEKLLLLRDRMHTPLARRLARPRHEYLVEFLKRFREEWMGKA